MHSKIVKVSLFLSLPQSGLKIKKTRRSRFVLVTKDSNNNAEVESTTATENNESVAEVESEGATA